MTHQDPSQPPNPVVPPAYGPPQPTNTNAIVGFCLSLGGIFVCPLILSGFGIWLGGKAKREIAARNEGGAGLATAAVVIGWIGVVLAILWVVLFIAVFSFGDVSTSTSTS